ncbi:hypothetical protein ABT336_07610, partial [Micromonospora sp. NPDC000207]
MSAPTTGRRSSTTTATALATWATAWLPAVAASRAPTAWLPTALATRGRSPVDPAATTAALARGPTTAVLGRRPTTAVDAAAPAGLTAAVHAATGLATGGLPTPPGSPSAGTTGPSRAGLSPRPGYGGGSRPSRAGTGTGTAGTGPRTSCGGRVLVSRA